MRDRYLEVTFRKGQPFAAYLHLPRVSGAASVRSAEIAPSVVADYGADGELMGFEFTSPRRITDEVLAAVDRALAEAGVGGLPARDELAPLARAA